MVFGTEGGGFFGGVSFGSGASQPLIFRVVFMEGLLGLNTSDLSAVRERLRFQVARTTGITYRTCINRSSTITSLESLRYRRLC